MATTTTAFASPQSPPFSSLPHLHLRAARSAQTKPAFLSALRTALLDVGFLYLDYTGDAVLPEALVQDVVREGIGFFDLPEEEKRRIEMKHQKSFLGWSRLDNETTASRPDHREQLDLSTPHPLPGPTAPNYHNLLAPNQWPSAELLPRFQPVLEAYMVALGRLSSFFIQLVAEALGMPPDAFARFFDADQQHKLKLVRYPEVGPEVAAEDEQARQGVGPHKDSMLASFLLQASAQRGLQVLNAAGAWVDAPPEPGTLVVAFGQGLEALTQGVAKATTHRVLSPYAGQGARYSIPFFQGVSYDARFEEMEVPDAVRALKRCRGGEDDGVDFAFVKGRWGHLGEATLVNRVRSHPDVGERWYPEIVARIRGEQQ
ncbi:uncharacterized protein K452DRAFT_274367 [Aplosporella prunicola CBS 121167]|uniref:Fe2OG dioxygenase domain-containing protein n=1 Tax=Aplosporella prunicola CBS 121167 TaxID=1176127 RepID=A0A6A6B6X8_9PEZI|nr:uncharacterized protein K452DRAFT_274367 [Aplosporella prunicola CBS 121167]KAF2139869.1 hypothetical protein K452DRAFT_274367 [Aplosporella prunicola CBS 121167]